MSSPSPSSPSSPPPSDPDDSLRETVPPYREWTWSALITALAVGSTMCVAFVYSGLKLGFTLAGSTIAAILGFAVLRVLGGGRGSILEVNQVQTGASAVNVASSGIVFTIPAIYLLGLGRSFDPWSAVLAGIAGTIIGLTVIVPLRKQIIEFDRLRFPSGLAVASILRAPGESKAKARLLLWGFALSGVLVLLTQVQFLGGPDPEVTSLIAEIERRFPGQPWAVLPQLREHMEQNAVHAILPDRVDIGALLHIPAFVKLVFGLSLLNVAAGLLAGRGGLPMLAGAILAWWIVAPLAHWFGWTIELHELQEAKEPGFLYFSMLRPLGIGILIGGALMGVVLTAPALRAAIRSLAQSRKMGGVSDEAGLGQLGIGLAVGLLLLLGSTTLATELTFGDAVITTIVGAIWLALAGLIVAQATGMTDISPISGMALIAVTLMVFLVGGSTEMSLKAAILPAIFVGAAVCVGASQCADMMQDFKTGHLVGARPKLQQLTQGLLTWIGPLIAVWIVVVLWGPHGGGFGEGTDLPAPQGEALKEMVQGVTGGDAPWDKYGLGALLGASLSMLPVAGVAVLVGLAMYLPAYITLSYGVGCLISMALQRAYGTRFYGEKLVPFAAGLILGEALIAVGINLVLVFTGSGGAAH